MNTEKFISVFDMFKIGVGPSSSHTLGPWRAAQLCLESFAQLDSIDNIQAIQILLYGSLAKTGKGHGTDMAVLMGLMGEDPIQTNTQQLIPKLENIQKTKQLRIAGRKQIAFDYEKDLLFLKDKSLPFHPNALQFIIHYQEQSITYTYYSIGGGFVEEDPLTAVQKPISKDVFIPEVPFNFFDTEDLLHWCMKTGMQISAIVKENEQAIQSEEQVHAKLDQIWDVMLQCVYNGCKTQGVLPGGLQVRRRAFDLNQQLLKNQTYDSIETWMELIRKGGMILNIF